MQQPSSDPSGASSYLLGYQGQQRGPYPLEHVQAMVAAGVLPEGTVAWQPGMAEWVPVQTLATVVPPTPQSPSQLVASQATPVGADLPRLNEGPASAIEVRSGRPLAERSPVPYSKLPWIALGVAFIIYAVMFLYVIAINQEGRISWSALLWSTVTATIGAWIIAVLMAVVGAIIGGGIGALLKSPFRVGLNLTFSVLLPTLAVMHVLALLKNQAAVAPPVATSVEVGESTTSPPPDPQPAVVAQEQPATPAPVVEPPPAPKEEEPEKIEPPKTYEDKLSLLRHEVTRDITKAHDLYTSARDKAGLNTLLDARRLIKDQDFAESRAILSRCVDGMQTYQEQLTKGLNLHAERADRYGNSPSEKEKLREAFEILREQVLERTQLELELEDAVLKEITRTIEFLEQKMGRWSADEDGSMIFDYDEDYDAYAKFATQLQSYAERQQQLRAGDAPANQPEVQTAKDSAN